MPDNAPPLFLRRAFLLTAFAALAQTANLARADEAPTLWDTLAQAAMEAPGRAAATAPKIVRHALGPIPGYTVPLAMDTSVDDAIFAAHKKRRGSVFGPVGDYVGRLQSATGTKIVLHGSSTFSYRSESVSGSADSYTSDQYYGQGSNGLYNLSRMDVDATFFNSLHYKTTFNNDALTNRNDPNYNRVQVDYRSKSTRIQWGDINAGFQGNSLIDFSRYMHGVQIKHDWTKEFSTQAIYSAAKTETRTITLVGNGSSGPYYVYAGQIVDGTARVRINNRDLTMGKDFTLDLYTGELRFVNSVIALPSDTIAVSFETLGYGSNTGNLYGIRAEYAPIPALHVGLTDIVQTSNASSGPQLRTQEFYGYNTPGAAYVLDAPIDATKPLTVLVGGVPLVRGVDYVIDANLTNQIRIAQLVPSTLLVKVQYVPLANTVTPGNRSVLGFDSRLSLGKWGSVSTELATSGLSVSGSDYSGWGGQISANLNPLRGLHTSLILRDVNPTFSSIQTPGFNRNEKSLAFESDYTPDRNWQFNLNFQKAKRPAYSSSSYSSSAFTVNTLGNDDYTNYGGGIRYAFAKTGSLSFNHDSTGTNYIQGGQSSNTSDRLNATYSLYNVTLNASLSRNASRNNTPASLISATNLSSLYNSDSNTFSKQIGINWTPNQRLSFSASTSDNAIHTLTSGSNSRTTARESQLAARFMLARNVTLNYSYSLSDTGNLYGLATTATTGAGATTHTGTGTTGTTGTAGTTTGTGANGTGSATRGVPAPFAFMQQVAQTRDVTAGGSGTTAASSGATGTALGGGSNYNLGSAGNYSGAFGTGLNTGYGIGSYGGRSASNRIGLEVGPIHDVTLGITLDSSNSLGDNQYNSNRNNVALQMGWRLSNRWTFDGSFSVQKVAYTGTLGASTSNYWQVNMGGHPFGNGVSILLSLGSQRTDSNLNFASATGTATTGTTTGTTVANSGNTDLTSLRFRIDYPISNRYSLFTDIQQSDATGYLGSSDSNLSFGLSYSLTKALSFSLGWQVVSRINKDPQYAAYNYKASSVLAQLGFNFR